MSGNGMSEGRNNRTTEGQGESSIAQLGQSRAKGFENRGGKN